MIVKCCFHKILSLCFLLFLNIYLHGQIITTFAGNGTSTFSGMGGNCRYAGIPVPNPGNFDKYGNYYFPLPNLHRIARIDTFNVITIIAGNGISGSAGDGGLATDASLHQPCAVAVDGLGNIYVADAYNNTIRKISTSTGYITRIAGTNVGGYSGDGGPATDAKLSIPNSICFDRKGNLYISEAPNRVVRKIDTHGIISTFAGNGTMGYSGDNGPATLANLDYPCGLASDKYGNIFIADPGALCNRIRKVDTLGIIKLFAGNGNSNFLTNGLPATISQFSPSCLAFDLHNNLFVSDGYNERIYRIGVDGILNTIAGNGIAGFGGDGGMSTNAELYSPNGIALDACGNLYITEVGTLSIPDSGNNIRKVTFDSTCDPYKYVNLSISNISASSITIYPNPVINICTLVMPSILTSISIDNIAGQTLFTQTYNTSKAEIDMSSYPAGIYIVKVMDKEGGITRRKIVKE